MPDSSSIFHRNATSHHNRASQSTNAVHYRAKPGRKIGENTSKQIRLKSTIATTGGLTGLSKVALTPVSMSLNPDVASVLGE